MFLGILSELGKLQKMQEYQCFSAPFSYKRKNPKFIFGKIIAFGEVYFIFGDGFGKTF